MSYLRSTLRGSLALFGVALGLIGTAGVASADDAAPTSEEDAVVVTAAQEEEAEIGDGLFIERPAPRPDPGNELVSDPAPSAAPAPTPAPAPAPAPSATPAASGGASAAAQTTATGTSATLIPARPTEVRGVVIERGATATGPASAESVSLARTGIDTGDLTVLAGVLLVLGALLVRTTRPRRHTI